MAMPRRRTIIGLQKMLNRDWGDFNHSVRPGYVNRVCSPHDFDSKMLRTCSTTVCITCHALFVTAVKVFGDELPLTS